MRSRRPPPTSISSSGVTTREVRDQCRYLGAFAPTHLGRIAGLVAGSIPRQPLPDTAICNFSLTCKYRPFAGLIKAERSI